MHDSAAGADMSGLIIDEVIPRLIAAHFGPVGATRRSHGADLAGLPMLEASRVADASLSLEPGALIALIDLALDAGLSTDMLLVDVLAPAARFLGQRWEDDSLDFVDVTMGLWRMQEAVHEIADRCAQRAEDEADKARNRRAFFAVMPGDTHSFGSVMLEEMFQLDGWTCRSCRDGTASDINAELAAGWFDVVALTASIDTESTMLARLITGMRFHSRNPAIRVMVGGRHFGEHPGLAEQVGADAASSDARDALQMAELLVEQTGVELLAGGSTLPGRLSARSAPRVSLRSRSLG